MQIQSIVIGFHLLISFILIVVVLMQEGNDQGISGAISGGADTFFGQGKGKTLNQKLKRLTSIVAALFIVTSVVLSLII